MQSADVSSPAANPTPYKGVQYVDIPESQAIGTSARQAAASLTRSTSVDQALQQSQTATERFMKHTRYIE
ncbi:MAG: hypothetical protein ACAF41_17085 [Leptolyngbya sp. BL-A-14]